jgi:hypothetical protein
MFCILILTSASTPFILGKSRMRKRARTDLCGGRPAMVVPTATVTPAEAGHFRTYYLTALGPTGFGTTPFQKPARNGPRNP